MSTPEHIAIILDGNGRWAKSKGMPRNYGHTVGAKNVENICKAANDLGVKYLTLYAFSTENWNRPESEVASRGGASGLRKGLCPLTLSRDCVDDFFIPICAC